MLWWSWLRIKAFCVNPALKAEVQICSPAGKQRLCQGAAGSEHQGSDGGAGRAPRLPHPGSGGGAAETRRGAGCSGVREAQLDGARRPPGVHTGAAEGNRPALLCAGRSPHPQQVLLVHILFLTGGFNNVCLICCFCLLNRLTLSHARMEFDSCDTL